MGQTDNQENQVPAQQGPSQQAPAQQAPAQTADAHPRTFTELLISLFWNPPWKRRFILIPAVFIVAVVLPVLQFMGEENVRDFLEHVGIVRSTEFACWSRTLRPADSHITGLRVIERSTTLDLQGWNPTTEDQVARKIPVSLVVSRNQFTIERTDVNQGCFIHRMGTSSGIEPRVHCERCRKVPLSSSAGALKEWDLVFDIGNKPLGEPIPIVFDVDFWNSFQRPDQWWGGFRILHATEKAVFKLVFPESRRPKVDRLQYKYVKTASQSKQDVVPQPADLLLSTNAGHVERVTWAVPHPQPDRSYRIYWEW